jgi:pimeloyl-ACP methyl ester carboxylesterase
MTFENRWDGFARRMLRVNGTRLHIVEAGGEHAGTPMVLVSGWPQSIYVWRKVIPRLSQRRRVIAIDPPGLGWSDPLPGGEPDSERVATLLHAALEQLGVLGEGSKVDFIGHDIGAWLAYPFAVKFPAAARRVVVIDALVPGLAPPQAYAMTPDTFLKTWHFAFNALPDLPDMLIAGRERLYLEWLFRSRSFDPVIAFDAHAIDEYVACYARTGAMRAGFGYYRAIFASAAQNRAYAAAGKVKVPILAVGGAQWLGPAIVSAFEAIGENVTGALVDNCGHFVPEEQPEKLAELILEFCKG